MCIYSKVLPFLCGCLLPSELREKLNKNVSCSLVFLVYFCFVARLLQNYEMCIISWHRQIIQIVKSIIIMEEKTQVTYDYSPSVLSRNLKV